MNWIIVGFVRMIFGFAFLAFVSFLLAYFMPTNDNSIAIDMTVYGIVILAVGQICDMIIMPFYYAWRESWKNVHH